MTARRVLLALAVSLSCVQSSRHAGRLRSDASLTSDPANAPSDLSLQEIARVDDDSALHLQFRLSNNGHSPVYFKSRDHDLEWAYPWIEWQLLTDAGWIPAPWGWNDSGTMHYLLESGRVCGCKLAQSSAFDFECEFPKARRGDAQAVRCRLLISSENTDDFGNGRVVCSPSMSWTGN